MSKNDSNDECLICFKKKHLKSSLKEFFFPEDPLCYHCRSKFAKIQKSITVNGMITEVLYEYDEYLSKLFIQYKELYDEALAPIFIYPYHDRLHRKYHDFVIVGVPSRNEKIIDRGFDHLSLLYSSLNLPMIELFVNLGTNAQKKNSLRERMLINKDIYLKSDVDLSTKKVLLVDDIITTGASLSACHKLLVDKCLMVQTLVVAGNKKYIAS